MCKFYACEVVGGSLGLGSGPAAADDGVYLSCSISSNSLQLYVIVMDVSIKYNEVKTIRFNYL